MTRVCRGELFEVAVREPAASAYRWRLAEVPDELTIVDERYEPPQPGPLGSAGRRVIAARAHVPGHFTFRPVGS